MVTKAQDLNSLSMDYSLNAKKLKNKYKIKSNKNIIFMIIILAIIFIGGSYVYNNK